LPALRFSSLRAFKHPGYLPIWTGALVSNIGSWMESVALGVYVTEVTGKAEWTGGIAALTFLPGFFLSPVGGALADRFDRRLYLAAGTVGQMVLAGILTVLAFTHQLSVPMVAVCAFLNGCIGLLMVPGFSALLASLVPPEDVHSAISLKSAQINLGRIIGPMLTALVLAAWGLEWALLINTVSFAAVLAALSRLRQPPRTGGFAMRGLGKALWADISQGLRFARQDPGIRLVLWITLLASALVAPFIGLVAVFAIRVLGQGGSGTSLLVTAQGAGAVMAAVGVGLLVDAFGRSRVLVGAILTLGPLTALYWLAPTLPLAAVAIFLLGANYLMCMTGIHTVCQMRAPQELRARMSSLFGMMFNGGYALGVWLQGALADRLGVRFITVLASLSFLVLVLGQRLLRPRSFDTTQV
jgi:predicted MFS family arabinose efflux permease